MTFKYLNEDWAKSYAELIRELPDLQVAQNYLFCQSNTEDKDYNLKNRREYGEMMLICKAELDKRIAEDLKKQ